MSIRIITPDTYYDIEAYDVSEVDMGLNTITLDLRLPADVDPRFTLDWYVEYKGERFNLKTLEPSGVKDNSSLQYKYSLTFNSARYELSFVEFLDLVDLENNNLLPRSSDFSFNGTLTEFVDRFNLNLKFYFGDKWKMANASTSSSDTRVLVTSSRSSMWDLLVKLYDLYKVRWTIDYSNNTYTINVGALPVEVEHVFEYGYDTGLYSIERVNPMKDIVSRLRGKGSNINLPTSYFHAGDPDTNDIVKSMYYSGIMPQQYRDYIRGWNSGVSSPSESSAYNKGADDKISGNRFQPIDFSDNNIDKWGIRYGSLPANELIFPTIQGVSIDGLGRIDEVVAVEQVNNDDWEAGEEGGFSLYFNIWIKDIGFDLRDVKYWATENMKVMFSDGLLAGEDYEFQIMGREVDGKMVEPYIYEDSSKSLNGVSSKYRIVLQKSDAEKEASGKYLPNIMQQGKAGDHFFFINIQLPHIYITEAEKRVKDWLDAEVAETSSESPTFSVKISAIFFDEFSEKLKVRCGAKLRLRNEKLIGISYLPVYIQSMTTRYSEGKILPVIDVVLSDEVVASQNAIQMLQSSVNSINSGYLSKDSIAEITRNSERFFLRKDGIADTSFSPTTFRNNVTAGGSIESTDFKEGFFGGTGFGIFKDANGNSLLEIDNVSIRRSLNVNEVIINQVSWVGGIQMLTAAGITCSLVEETTDRYKCYFETKQGSVKNHYAIGDQAYSQRFDLDYASYYWRLVIGVGEDYIELSKTDKDGIGIPKVDDNIVQLGNRDNVLRQNAIILSSYGSGSPDISLYAGIDMFSLVGKSVSKLSPYGSHIDGSLTIREGSTGYQNIEGLPERFDNLISGSVNLLRNSGFTGNFESKSLTPESELETDTPLFSDNLIYWDGFAIVNEDSDSRSGFSATLSGYYLYQALSPLIVGESYIISFKAKGSNISVLCGGLSVTEELSDDYKIYTYKFTYTSGNEFKIYGNSTVCEIMMERGNIRSDWNTSPLDNDRTLERFQDIKYISDAIRNASTEIRGGLILSSMMQLGNFINGVMSTVTAGMSGTYNTDSDVAFWAGGTLEQAIRAVNSPMSRVDTAKAIITHGGKLIANEAVIRGTLYATDGEFSGKLVAPRGVIGGFNIESDKLVSQGTDDDGNPNIVLGGSTGDADITGRFQSNHKGNRIIVDPEDQSIKLIDDKGNTLGQWRFYATGEASGNMGMISLVSVNSSNVVTNRNTMTGNSISLSGGEGLNATNVTVYPDSVSVKHSNGNEFSIWFDSNGRLIVRMIGIPNSRSGLDHSTIYRDGDGSLHMT